MEMLFGHQPDNSNTSDSEPIDGLMPSEIEKPSGEPETNTGFLASHSNNSISSGSIPAPHSKTPLVASDSGSTDDNPLSDDSTPTAPQAYSIPDDSLGDTQQENDAIPLESTESSDLLSLKQQALEELAPLVGHLDQTPEEKFRTTMMMIQSTDNQSLIQDAFVTAKAIPDEKVRAQALLDVINEINYFTQKNK